MRIIYRFPTLNPIHHSGEGQRKHRKHDRGARDCRQSQHFRTFVFHIYHDKRVLQRENGHERVYEADRQKQANESVRRSFLLMRLTDAMITLHVVYAAVAIAGINVISTGFF